MVDHLQSKGHPQIQVEEEVQVGSLFPLASVEGLHYFQLDLEGPVVQANCPIQVLQ